jgi:copper transport protein
MTRLRLLLLLVVALTGVSGLVVADAEPASAHAVVTSSTPTDGQTLATAPREVQITFSENVSSELGGLTVLNSSGERVDNNDSKTGATGSVLSATVQSDLPNGTYVMNYHVISADGHPIAGAIVFGVGSGTVIDTSGVQNLQAGKDPGFEFAAGVARFVTYVGAMLAAGLAVFVTFLHDQRSDRWKLTPIVRIAAVVGGIGAVATVALQAALLTGNGFSAMTDVSTLRQALTEGLDWATVLLLAGLAMVHLSTDTTKTVVAQSLAFYGALVVAGSFAFWGHSTTADPRWLSFIADFVHVAAGAVWLGGLVGLGVTLWNRRTRGATATSVAPTPVAAMAAGGTGLPPEPSPLGHGVGTGDRDTAEADVDGPDDLDDPGLAASTAAVVSRFSNLAAMSLLLLVIAGTAMAWKELGSVGALGSTSYGRALLVKIGLVLVILVGAAYNRFRLMPVVEADEATFEDERTAWRHLNRSVVAEAAGIVVVLAVTALLVNLTPPKNASATEATTAVQTLAVTNTDAKAEVVLTPSKVGANSVHITYFNSSNQPVDVAQQVSVELTQPDQGIGPIQRDAVKAATGHFIIDGMQVPTAGTWKLTLITRISDFDQERTDFTYKVTS